MISVLFVDDEQSILQGIKRVTRSMRSDWDMHFCDSGPEALELLRQRDIDVVVSDMRMPGMDGAELLGHVRTLHPGIARIILSGYADEESVYRSTRVAHQFLSKPCDVEELRNTIQRIRACRDAVQPTVIRDLVGSIGELPALGHVYSELMMTMETDSSSSEALGVVVEKDVALTAELLRLVNSTFFGLAREITSAAQAISFLGLDVVRAIVVGHSLFDGEDDPIIDLNELGHRSRVVAGLARRSVKSNGGNAKEAAEAYLAGMLHEVGALALARLPDVDNDVLKAVLSSGDPTNERLEFEVDRFVAGGYLLGLWGFTSAVVDSISGLSNSVADIDTTIARALGVARRVTTSPIDISESLTDEQLDAILQAAEENTLFETDMEELTT